MSHPIPAQDTTEAMYPEDKVIPTYKLPVKCQCDEDYEYDLSQDKLMEESI